MKSTDSELYGVSCVNAINCTAVGFSGSQTLVETSGQAATSSILLPSNGAALSGMCHPRRHGVGCRRGGQGPVRAHRWLLQPSGHRHGHTHLLDYLLHLEHDERSGRHLHAAERGRRQCRQHRLQRRDLLSPSTTRHRQLRCSSRRMGRPSRGPVPSSTPLRLPPTGSTSPRSSSCSPVVPTTSQSSARPLPPPLVTSTAGTRRAVPGGTYTLQSLATDAAGNTAYSPGIVITVDNTPPATAVLIPSTGRPSRGRASALDATASAAFGVQHRQGPVRAHRWSLQQVSHRHGDTHHLGYLFGWNTTSVPGGYYTLQSLATDAAGNTSYSPGIIHHRGQPLETRPPDF